MFAHVRTLSWAHRPHRDCRHRPTALLARRVWRACCASRSSPSRCVLGLPPPRSRKHLAGFRHSGIYAPSMCIEPPRRATGDACRAVAPPNRGDSERHRLCNIVSHDSTTNRRSLGGAQSASRAAAAEARRSDPEPTALHQPVPMSYQGASKSAMSRHILGHSTLSAERTRRIRQTSSDQQQRLHTQISASFRRWQSPCLPQTNRKTMSDHDDAHAPRLDQ